MNGFSFFAAGIMVYIAVIVFLVGMAYQIYGWVKTPRSSVKLGIFPRPKNKVVRFFKLLKDSFIFPHSAEVLTMHVFFVNLFVMYFPFSKLTHAIGTFAVNTVRSDA